MADICDIILPIFIAWKFTSLPIYKLKGSVGSEKRRFICGKSYTSYLGIGVFLFITWPYLQTCFLNDGSKMHLNMSSVELCIRFFYDIGIILLCHKNKKEIGRIPSELLTNEKLLENLTEAKILYYKSIKITILLISVLKYATLVSAFLMEFFTRPTDQIDTFVYYSTWCFQFHSQLIITLYFIILKKQYEILNNYLDHNKIKYFSNNKIKNIIEMHSCLRRIIRLIKKAFQHYLFMKTLMDLSMTSTGIFYLIQVILRKGYNNALVFFVSVSLWFGLSLAEDFTTAIIYETILKQVCKIDLFNFKN